MQKIPTKPKSSVGASRKPLMYGPIQKLHMPDFQHISDQFEQMQNEAIERPNSKRPPMKNVTIRKTNNQASQRFRQSSSRQELQQPQGSKSYRHSKVNSSLQTLPKNGSHVFLTREENMTARPDPVQNPWIYDQTHQEYLEKIKGLPARNAKVVKTHNEVKKETIFLPQTEDKVDKDQVTKGAVALLDAEYEIFKTPDLLPVKALSRYDTWDEEKTVEEWLEYCRNREDQAHALSPVYTGNDYEWKPVQVLDYDYGLKKYKVRVIASGMIKKVTRLSLLFLAEDSEKFKQRVIECKLRQRQVEEELRFTNLVDSVPHSAVSSLSKERRFYFLFKSISDCEGFDPEKVYDTFKHNLKVVEEEFIRQMKKCVIMAQMEDPVYFQNFKDLKVPLRLQKRTLNYFGVVRCPKYNFSGNLKEIQQRHFTHDSDLVAITRVFVRKSYDAKQWRFLNTNHQNLRLPKELSELQKIQAQHHSAVCQNTGVQWREFLIGEIHDRLRKKHNFFEASDDTYQKSQLRRTVIRFELMLNTYMREFVQISVDDWVSFIKRFSMPKEWGTQWRMYESPLVTVHLAIKKKERRKTINKKKKEEESDEDDKHRIVFTPSLQECQDWVISGLDKIVASTNQFCNLEPDLLPFMNMARRPSFSLERNFPWIEQARNSLNEVLEENMERPKEILQSYKEFEYILNVDKRALIEEIFKGADGNTKKSLKEIQKYIQHYEDAYFKIMTLTHDDIDFPLFRILTKKLKLELAERANKIKDLILKSTYDYCTDTVNSVLQEYSNMYQKITREPMDEKELVESKEFVQGAPLRVEELTEVLKEVSRHYNLLEHFSYMYQELDIEKYWYMKIWPIKIQAQLTDAKSMLQEKDQQFGLRLELEKEQFLKQLVQLKIDFDKVKTFSDLDTIDDFEALSVKLSNDLSKSFFIVAQFHYREGIFNLPETPYPELEELQKAFKPFYELIIMAKDITQSLKEWTHEKLMGKDSELISSSIDQWAKETVRLFKLFQDAFPHSGNVAQMLQIMIKEFSKNLPLIECFTSYAITDEDWREIQEVVKRSPFERDDIKVAEFGDLYQYIGQIEEITMRAQKKYLLQQRLKQMKDEMKAFMITLLDYKGMTHIVKGYDEINARLDDQIVATQEMNGSSFCKNKLKSECRNWDQKLNGLSLLFEEILKTQRTWMYLEPIFSSEDMMNTMPVEAKLFNEVDTVWKTTMKGIEEEPCIMELADKENIMFHFQESNKKLDRIQKSLNEYLEMKRLIFPRFFFLADSDLLQIMAQTKNPKLVQPHMNKCFEGIYRVQFTENDCVKGMISSEQEEVQFLKEVDVNAGDKKGNVEKWMLEIEAQMVGSLKSLAKQALEAYNQIPRTQWVRMWPGQIVLAISQIFWTQEVELAIKELGQQGLQDFTEKLQEQIEGIVQLVRNPLKDQERITLKSLVVLDVHARDVVVALAQKGVQSIDEFDWTAQLRYYWDQNEKLMVRMVTAEIPYSYEYLGNSTRLVITALTDRCYRTLLGAKYLNYGGAPEGPAGTGKTESVKDLAKAIAVLCVVFNCSDGLDYMAMGKFFKGLAASGAWCCFDEFNRIDLEVLSVIAQQIQCIQTAIKNVKYKTFLFDNTELKLNRACAINITMNPGYAGRSELPDNLKALFRPCAMMVPDYANIAEIELYSFGFSDAASLSVKIVASLRLSSELLSSQFHYDFGMRAVKSILTACGNQRRILKDWPEDFICLKALNDVNLPKFTSNDIPLFKGITNDLFPGVKLPEQDYSKLIMKMKESCLKNNLEAKEVFIEKCIQLYETIMVRHGLMVVGDPYSGKSSVIKLLQQAMSSLKDDPDFENVLTYYVNPKSITQNQLYGVFDLNTQEWSDGVLAIRIRECSESETPDRKWICFDGPVDAVWIENMNTVLDDNKKLCLSSGQIIKLTPSMTIMFQVDDLSQASPATVSRCGMVLMESHQLGHNVFISSFINELKSVIEDKLLTEFEKQFHFLADLCLEFTRKNGKFPCAGSPAFLVNHMIKLVQCFMTRYLSNSAEGETPVIPNDIKDKLSNMLIFSAVWGIGGCLDEVTRPKFNSFLIDLLSGVNVIQKYQVDLGDKYDGCMKYPNKIGREQQCLFDYFFDMDQMKWVPWLSTEEKYFINKDDSYLALSIPTTDSVRMSHICKTLLSNSKHCLLVGPTGTGKSISINKLLKRNFDNDHWTYFSMGFSAQTSANQTQRIIDGKMERKRKGVYGPQYGKEGVIFVDDLNMPQKEKYQAQPPIELLRQWMDYQGWYDIDTPDKDFRKIVNVRFAGAMGPPGDGRNSISSRYIRHFNVLYIEPYSDQSLKYIFETVMDWFFMAKNDPPFSKGVVSLRDQIVSNTIFIYQETMRRFRPTPAKSHYTYNLRDVSKVFQGISKATARAIQKEEHLIKLWAHECMRVFQDRMVSQEDRDTFKYMISGVIKGKFKMDWNSLVKVEPLLFGSFVPLCYPNGDTTLRPYTDVYCELEDRDKTKKQAMEALIEFNSLNLAKKMDLVLFMSAIEHIAKIHRIITTEFGHALLIGVGGSGRKSLTELSIFIANFESFQIEITNAYNFESWREDMRTRLFMNCGVDEKPTVFLISDTQIVRENFLEDLNNVLNNGDIPNLFSASEDFTQLIENMREQNKQDSEYKNLTDTVIWQDFLQKCKKNIHIVLAMSPIGDDFKRRLRMFPSLVNCCAIDWFLPWPKEALQSVAEHFLKNVKGLPMLDGIVSICVDMQLRTTMLAEKYKIEQKSYYYVTPTSYLVLIKAFKELLEKKRRAINSVITKYEKGIDQLSNAKDEVNILQQKLEELLPQLKYAKKQTADKIVEVENQKKAVAEIRIGVEQEERAAKDQKIRADEIERECNFELTKVMPIYNNAMKAVSNLKKDNVVELKGFLNPPPVCIAVVKTLCIMFKVDPVKVGQGKDKQEDYWEPGKKKVLTGDLLKNCKTYDKDNIEPEIVENLRKIIESDEYDDAKLQNASLAAWGLSKWVRAMVQYDDAMKVLKPKKVQLKEAQKAATEAQAEWDKALDKLKRVEAEMQKLIEEFDEAKAKEQDLSEQYDEAEKKCRRAKTLIEKLSDEEVNWGVSLRKNKEDRENLVGDIIISSGVIAYLGAFSVDYRAVAVSNWVKLMKSFEIKSADKFSLKEVLGNGVKIQQWHISELPQEDFAVENAIIMEHSDRWPLMIDPQMQGNNWIKQMEKERIKFIKPTMSLKIQTRILKNAINMGLPIVFEDAGEIFDPIFDPLLGKQIDKKGSICFIKLGDEQVEYSQNFSFYITTKVSRPHYSPEICVKLTLLNFMVTEKGLEDQMLNVVVTHEDPNSMKKRNEAILKKASNERKKAELEDKILNQIANSDDNILEDDVLIETLDESKVQCKQIEIQVKEAEVTMHHIESIRDQFSLVAHRVARLFFVLVQLMNVDPMYQYSLKFFKTIYQRALNAGGHIEKSKRNDRKYFFIKEFTRLLYQNICRSLFEKDKLLFSLLLCLKIMDECREIDHREVRFMMTGGTRVEFKSPNPSGQNGWISDKMWASINQLSEEFTVFKGLDENFRKNLKEWETLFNHQKPHSKKAVWPSPFNQLTFIQQTMFLRVFRPDKVIPVIQKMIKKHDQLGIDFIQPPPFDLDQSFSDSSPTVPIIIILSPGADPMSELNKLAHVQKARIESISLGQGQAQIAIDAIQKAKENQDWVVLQNCHLCPSFMPTLDAIIEELNEENQQSKFRIWLTSMPSNQFPVSILQNGVKATLEPPKGLKNNMLRSYMAIDKEDFESCDKPQAYKSLMWGLCFFNALILERRKYGPLGWNIPYEFSNSDLSISQAQLMMFLNHYENIPWEALRYMVAEANYGGRVTDANDRVTLNFILEDFYNPSMLKKNNPLCEGKKYFVPDVGPVESYIEFIQTTLPLNDLTLVFGLHDNAEITSAIGQTNKLLETALSLQAAVSKGENGKSQDELLKEIALEIIKKLPKEFDLEEASKKHPIIYEDSMNTVLMQELLRYNRLLNCVRSSLQNVGKAIQGEIPLSLELENVCLSLYNNQVPEIWHANAYPSLKPLASWVLDFVERLNFMNDWVEKGSPANFWISGFYFTQSFMTGAKQNFSRKYMIAIDQVEFDFIIISDESKYDLTVPPKDGVYVHGFFLEGARWDEKRQVLQESMPKVLFTQMKTIWILPKHREEINYGHSYKCPVYRTASRAGTLSTTGHSTNFVLYIYLHMEKKQSEKHWVKRGVAMLTQLSD